MNYPLYLSTNLAQMSTLGYIRNNLLSIQKLKTLDEEKQGHSGHKLTHF